ncbi:SDR family oxidoreductase [Conexibacter sp. JD483]|uniref:SDR family NAD(P)-dependent oxidoreductase n=1 Tax=unclassified Conexibacter TaxID=2627773 RepID=UPI0027284591|nr:MULTISPECIES: glucose 1-dehydrogenase [unclassified Conexibacter]MDO8187830.1 SDR family oxidoreductase [Conexibacter sp. CPCC 205706]MDO8199961.1 SDR family oxidoreductase [Conexibacter sp. CPCC 205762]MDR9369488.1 SDR family oxidoreductase [Conexibacter sp. JD483]
MSAEGVLAGRAGVVTGGARGLGRAIAEAFAAAGARVAIVDVAGAQEAAAEIGAGALGLTGDVTDPDGVRAAFAEVAERTGRFDFLVNNAGVRVQAPFRDHPLDAWRRTLDVNLTGSFVCAQAAVALMLARGGGQIVNLASIAGAISLRDRVAYNASKGGVIALTQSIAAELSAQGIRCNAIAPGIVETPLSAPYFRDARMVGAITSNTPLGRWGQPHEIAGPAVFLCSPAAAFVHGQTLFVDGGWTAHKGY